MAYVIHNNYGMINIQLTSNITSALSLSYTRNGTAQSSITSTVTDGVHKWSIPLNQYSLGDTLDNFTVSTTNKYLWELDEGITILVNGEEYDTIHSNTFPITFDKADKYTIEAVYCGNDLLSMSSTGKTTFQVTQPPTTEESQISGNYTLEFVNKNISSMTYNDNTRIEFVLKKGGHPVRGKTVEKVTPNNIFSSDTNKDGIVGFNNTGYNAGKYKIGAYMYDYQDREDKKIVDSTYKTITIKKANPKITHSSSVQKGKTMWIYFRDNTSQRIKNEKVQVYINNKLYNKTTDKNGNVGIKMNNTGTFKFKVVYKGNKNLNAKTETFSLKVTK
ncbi:MAG: hypothetical protein J6Y78_04380 [Paludibacteraceae bacterium]|nr:hypothetical protein [Paludibacteraceae bacterium]